MSKVEDFLNAQEEQEVVNAIRAAELNTSGEIRVHIEKKSKKEALLRAKEVFHTLHMNTTTGRNGVIIYIAVKSKTFAIYGDEGISKVVTSDFWDSTKSRIENHFKKGAFKDGIVAGIIECGNVLKTHFPWEKGDQNELPNDISKG